MTTDQAITVIEQVQAINSNTEYIAGFMALIVAFLFVFSIFSFMYMRR